MYAVLGPRNFTASRIRKRKLNSLGHFVDSNDKMKSSLHSLAEDLRHTSSIGTRNRPVYISVGNVQICLPRHPDAASFPLDHASNMPGTPIRLESVPEYSTQLGASGSQKSRESMLDRHLVRSEHNSEFQSESDAQVHNQLPSSSQAPRSQLISVRPGRQRGLNGNFDLFFGVYMESTLLSLLRSIRLDIRSQGGTGKALCKLQSLAGTKLVAVIVLRATSDFPQGLVGVLLEFFHIRDTERRLKFVCVCFSGRLTRDTEGAESQKLQVSVSCSWQISCAYRTHTTSLILLFSCYFKIDLPILPCLWDM